MKTYALAFLIPALLLLAASMAAAQDVDLSIKPNNFTIDIFNPVKYTIFLKNNQKNTSFFSLFVSAIHPDWLTIEKTAIEVPFNQTGNFTLSALPSNDIGDFVFEVFAEYSPRENATERASANAYVTVHTPEKVLFKDFKVYQFGNRIEMDTFIKSLELVPVEAVFDLYNSESKIVKTVSKQIEANGQKRITEVVDFGDLSAGNYIVKAYVKGTSIRAETKFNVKLQESVSRDKKTLQKFLAQETAIRVINNGNDVVSGYSFSEEVAKTPPITLISFPSVKPVKEEERNKSFVYDFVIQPLRPGESTTVVYIVEEWPNTLLSLLIVVVIVAGALYLFFWMKNPRIRKRYVKRGRGVYSIILEARGSLLHGLEDATIRDWASPMAKIDHNFEGGVKPSIRESQYGSEIIWKLGPMKRGEQRAVSYTVKTVFQGASLKMPRAYIRYVAKGSNAGRTMSNELEILTG